MELAGGIIFNEEREILLLHRNTEELIQWELPGGKIEVNETKEEAVIRELKEELGIKVEITKYLTSKEFREKEHMIPYHWYQCKILQGTPTIREAKFDQVSYWSKKELENRKEELSPNMKNVLEYITIL